MNLSKTALWMTGSEETPGVGMKAGSRSGLLQRSTREMPGLSPEGTAAGRLWWGVLGGSGRWQWQKL